MKTSIIILSGFLGSGKSTLLKRFIEQKKQQQKKIGVLMNELGKVSIDSSLIPDQTPLKELLNGCICCSIQGELSSQLENMLNEYDLDIIFIEATGAAHPLEVIEAVTHPFFANRIEVRAAITVVNALQWKEGKMSIKIRKLLKEQVRFSNIVVLNKIDLVDGIEEIKQEIAEINPHAKLFATSFSEFDINLVSKYQKLEGEGSLHVKKDLHLKTITVELTGALDVSAFTKWLTKFQAPLYRAKGFIHLKGKSELFLFNFAFGEPMFERYHGEKLYQPVLVFIGEDLDKQEIENELSRFQ